MPDKKLKVKEVGAGDPTFILKIQFLNEDARDSADSVTIDSAKATMDNENVTNPIMDLGKTDFLLNRDIIIMSSFNAPEPDITGNTLPIATNIEFSPVSGIECDAPHPCIITGNSISFPEGIDALRILAPSLQDGGQTVGYQAVPDDDSPQGTNVFLAYDKNSDKANAVRTFISTPEYLWVTYHYVSLGYSFLLNQERSSCLMWDPDTEQLTWSPGNMLLSDKRMQWKIVADNEGKTHTLRNIKATEDNKNSYLHANTAETGDNVQLSGDPAFWYIHILE